MPSVLFIANPIAGGHSKGHIVSVINHEMADSGFDWDVRYTEYAGQAGKIAAETDADYVVAIGGDGTVDEVAAAIAGTDKILGIIPCGSGDGLARHMHVSHIPRFALKTIKSGRVVKVDHGEINGKPFFCTCGVGLDAIVSNRFATCGRRGLAAYIKEAFETWSSFVPERYELEIDGRKMDTEAVLITVGNADQWGNEAKIAPLASIRDGFLDITIIKPFKSIEIPHLAELIMDGRINRSKRVICMKCKHVIIHRETDGAAHFDGEPLILGKDIDIRIVPGNLNVIVPPSKADRI